MEETISLMPWERQYSNIISIESVVTLPKLWVASTSEDGSGATDFLHREVGKSAHAESASELMLGFKP